LNAAAEFLRRAAGEAADTRLRDTVRHNIASYSEAVVRGKLRFADWESARTRAQEIKREAISNLDRYLEAFEAKIIARGGHVFWAEDAASARAYICGLASKRAVRNVVKSKSMVTEEIDLRPELQARGINVVETDLGEYIVQLRNEPPYHILTPAMHLTRNQVAELFRDKIDPAITTDNPPELVAVARKKLRAEEKEGTIQQAGDRGDAARQAAEIGMTGAGIGAMSTGTAKGAGIGAAAGVAAVLIGRKVAGRGHSTVIPAGTQLTVSLSRVLELPDNVATAEAPVQRSTDDPEERRPILRRQGQEP
jgi:L-lactate dehydrogenase complex protein LldF